ncbi:MAG: HAMP domain-containing histidine kinase [Acidobacteriaceae bacterium]|nr:HAMP domain-containing histidine kinase [Acidobacteriaceae bacterium]
MVDQVLTFARSGAGQIIRERKPVTVETLIQDGVQSSSAVAGRADMDIEVSIQPGLPPILADSMAMRQVIQNLIDNAAKYGAEGNNWIGVSARAVHEGSDFAVEISVSDRGPGIPAGEQSHIFDPFFRGQRAIRDQVHGTGLGLNLVKKIVEAHGGTVRVESQPLHGATFLIRLPAAPPEKQNEFAHSLG